MATRKKAESKLAIGGIELSQEKLLSIGIVVLLAVSGITVIAYYGSNDNGDSKSSNTSWLDPITCLLYTSPSPRDRG